MFTDNMDEISGVGNFGRRKKRGLFGKIMRVSAGVATGGASELLIRRKKAKAKARKKAKAKKALAIKTQYEQRRIAMMERKRKADIEARTRKMKSALERKLRVVQPERELVTPTSVPAISRPARIRPTPEAPSMPEDVFEPAPVEEDLVPFVPEERAEEFAPEEEPFEEEEEPFEEEVMEEEEPSGEVEMEGIEYVHQGRPLINPEPRLIGGFAERTKFLLNHPGGPRPHLQSLGSLQQMKKQYAKGGIGNGKSTMPGFDQKLMEQEYRPNKVRNEFGFLDSALSGFGASKKSKKTRKTALIAFGVMGALIGTIAYVDYKKKKAAKAAADKEAAALKIQLQAAKDVESQRAIGEQLEAALAKSKRYQLDMKAIEKEAMAKAPTPEAQAQVAAEITPSFFQTYKVPLLIAGALSVGLIIMKR